MPLHNNVAGTWKDIVWWNNVAGTWKKITLHHNVAAVWKQITTLLSSLLPSTIDGNDLAISPLTAVAVMTLDTAGTWSCTGGGSGTWRGGGTSAEYDARFTVTSGSLSSGTAGTWQNLATSQSWARNETRDGFFESTCIGTLEVRVAASPFTVLSTTTVTLVATVEV